jgi:hypothetical protein
MRLVSIEPHANFTNLDQRSFICECGESIGDFVMRAD